MTTDLSLAAKEKRAIAMSSVAAAVFLTGFKLFVGLQTNSLGILSEAAHSGLDLLAAIITFLAVVVADKPPDDDHRYGHGKVENISAFLETLLLVVTCAWIIWEAVDRLTSHSSGVEATVWSFVVMGTSIVVDIGRSRALYRIARKHKSQALEADALHFSSDIWSSLTVIAGLFFVSIGYPEFDSIAAIAVALLVLFVSYRLGRRTIDALMDRAPASTVREIEDVVRTVQGVEEVRRIRVRTSGPRLFVDTAIAIARMVPFQRAHTIMDDVENAVQGLHPSADVVVHAEPFQSAEETVPDRVWMIVVGKGLRPPHNMEVHVAGGKHFIDFDVEYPKGQTFAEAHEVASEIEAEVYREIESVGKVTIHLEEYHQSARDQIDATETEPDLVKGIRETAARVAGVVECRNVALLREDERFNATLVCTVDRAKSLDEVHQITANVEAALFRKFKQLRRVTIQAEPK